ncbi:MAG: helix-turn-helix transcriptional regulator, partial [Clostridia bacterium]|nr:helix-turn-helix transcriptional regulator [Clostridia bacterium]
MDPNEKIRSLLEQNGWSEYKLAQNSGLSNSTIINIFRRNTVPSIPTLEAICRGFGITLSQFFAEGEMVEITPELHEIFSAWRF